MIIPLILLSLFAGLAGLLQPGGYLKLPTLAGLVFLIWFAPQIYFVSQSPFLASSTVFSLGMMATLSMLMIFVGWYLAIRMDGRRQPIKPIPVDLLITPLIVITVFTTGLNILQEQMRPSMTNISQWSGPIVIVAFFAQLRIVSLALSLLLLLRARTPAIVSLTVLNLMVNLPHALLFLRRSEMIDLAVVIVGSLWFARRLRLPAPLVIGGLTAFIIVVFTIGPLRGAQQEIEQSTGQTITLLNPNLWSKIDIGDTVRFNLGKAPDVRNAAYSIQATDEFGDYSYGGALWNAIIHQYVPSQLLGEGAKRSLQVEGGSLQVGEMASRYSYFYQTGTTSTGVGSAYREFGYFGCLFFFLIAFILGKLYSRGMLGSIWSQIGYLCLTPFALTTITHGHDKFFVMLPIYAFVISGLYLLTKIYGRMTGRLRQPRRSLAFEPAG